MKKLALTLAALATVSAVASAKEVVAAPVVTPEVVCPEPVKVWAPKGYADMRYTYYGEDEKKSQDFGRLQLVGQVTPTEKTTFWFRTRRFNNFDMTKANEATNTEMYLQQALGSLGQASWSHRVTYYGRHNLNGGAQSLRPQYLRYDHRINFAKYFGFMPEYFKPTAFTLAPRYQYDWTNNDNNYTNTLSLNLFTYWTLPLGFELEANAYPAWRKYGVNDNDQYRFAAEAYLYHTLPIWSNDTTDLKLMSEFGYEPAYTTADNSKIGDVFSDIKIDQYGAYALFTLEAGHKVNNNTRVYAGLAGNFRNTIQESEMFSKDWRWQPQAYVGFRTSF